MCRFCFAYNNALGAVQSGKGAPGSRHPIALPSHGMNSGCRRLESSTARTRAPASSSTSSGALDACGFPRQSAQENPWSTTTPSASSD